MAATTAVLTALPAASAAADWWVTGEGVDGSKAISDAESLKCADGRCAIWERIIPSPAEHGAKVVDSLAEYDCDGGRTATAAEATYDSQMAQLSFTQAHKLRWLPLDSGTVGQRGMLFACHGDVSRQPRGGEDSTQIQGELFVREFSTQPPPPSLIAEAQPAPAAPSLPPAPQERGPAHVAQIGALASLEAAQAVIDTFRARDPWLMSGLKATVEIATDNGRKVYRAVVDGFPSLDAAQAFCSVVRSTDRPCLVRTAAPG